MNKFKKFALLLMAVCLGCVFAGCSKFFTPLPDDFFNSKETEESVVLSSDDEEQPTQSENSSVLQTPENSSEVELPPETSIEDETTEPNSSEESPTVSIPEEVVPPTENSSEEQLPPKDESETENPVEPPVEDSSSEELPPVVEDSTETLPPENSENSSENGEVVAPPTDDILPEDKEPTDPTPPEDEEVVIPPPTENEEETDQQPIIPPVEEEIIEPIISPALTFTSGTHTLENYLIVCGEEDRAAVYAEGAGTVVIINSGVYWGGKNGSSAPAIYARDGARIIINGGDFYTGEGNSTIYAKNYSYIEINGGKFRADGAWQGKYYVLNLADNTNAKILVKGGEFRDFDPSNPLTEPSIVSFVETGYEVVFVENVANWYCVKKIEKSAE